LKIPKIETVAIDKLKPWKRNPRKNHAVDAIAKSIEQFGYLAPIIVQAGTYRILAGHGRLEAFKKQGATEIPVVVAELSDRDADLYTLADNKLTERADYDGKILAELLAEFKLDGLDLSLTGFEAFEISDILKPKGLKTEAPIPDLPATVVSKLGDVWLLGAHRLMCGDSTSAKDVEGLNVDAILVGQRAELLHADPPYGMGKEAEGVANDNLYASKLDDFQVAWWKTWRPYLKDNASAYVWGNPEDLWRLWWTKLSTLERLTFRNEITWDKREANPTMLVSGVPLESRRMYHPTERCLFFMLGEQGFNNNADNYWEGWEPIRSYLEGAMLSLGWTVKDLNRITKTQMGGHWVTRSQWSLITAEHYATLQEAARSQGVRLQDHEVLRKEYGDLKSQYDNLKAAFYATRAYFDNTHDRMTDVWSFERVTGAERLGHATPKPAEMIARALKSSSPPDGLVLEPFSGSGSTIIAAEQLGRRCFAMELQPAYVDVAVVRWQNFTKQKARNLTRPEITI
jgi:DNA modification methylase